MSRATLGERVTFRAEGALREAVERDARRQGVSLSDYLRRALQAHVASQ